MMYIFANGDLIRTLEEAEFNECIFSQSLPVIPNSFAYIKSTLKVWYRASPDINAYFATNVDKVPTEYKTMILLLQ